MDNMERFLRLIRCYYYVREMMDEMYIDSEDMEWILNLITPLIPYQKTRGLILKFDNSLMSDELNDLMDEAGDVICGEMYYMSVGELKSYDTHKIKRLYLIFLKSSDLKESEELNDLRDESIKLFDMLDGFNGRLFYQSMEEAGVLNECDDLSEEYFKTTQITFNLMCEAIDRELKRCGVIL